MADAYAKECYKKIYTIKHELSGIEEKLGDNLSEIRRNKAETRHSQTELKRIYDAVRKMEDGLTITMGRDYKKMNAGLESLAGEFGFVGKVISDKEYYNQSSFATLNDYMKTLEKAVKEPERAKAYINSFVLNSAKNKNAFSKKLVKKAYNKTDQHGKIRILKAYTERGIIDINVMNMFGINEKQIDDMIYTSKIEVLGYNKYKLK